MNKKVLIITNEFIPYTKSIGGVIRMLSLSKLLISEKYEVHILSSKSNYFEHIGYDSILKKLNLHYINANIKKNIFNQISSQIYLFFYRILNFFFYNFFHSLICLGYDQARGKIKNYKLVSDRFIKIYQIKYIIISSPPFSLFFISKYLKDNNNKIKIIHDYRDSWTLRFNSNHFLKKIASNYLEKKIILSSDFVVCASESISKKIKENFKNYKSNNIRVILNGYNHIYNHNIKDISFTKNKPIKIGYFGMISDNPRGYRNINEIYKKINCNEIKNLFRFHFYGPYNIKNKEILNSDIFFFHKTVDHSTAIKKMLEMDLLMLIHTEEETSEEVLTGKLFDYIYVRKPIIVISKGNTEAGELVKKNKIGFNFDLNLVHLKKELIKIEKQDIPLNNLSETDYKNYSRDCQNQKFLEILNE